MEAASSPEGMDGSIQLTKMMVFSKGMYKILKIYGWNMMFMEVWFRSFPFLNW